MAIEQGEAPVETPDEGSDAVSLPGSLLNGKTVTPGDVVRIEVVSPPDEDGQWTGKYASSPAPAKSDNTIHEMSARYKPAPKGVM